MIKNIISFFEQQLNSKVEPADQEHQLKLASASLLVEMIRMDHKIEQTEHDMVSKLIQKDFNLTEDETNKLFVLAEEESESAIDYYRFAKLINKEYENDKKIKIIENLWHIAYADGELDKYEEHYLRKVADLLHIPHKEFIQAKHRAIESKV